jgi:outer membrane immunogenic protein
MDRNTAGGRGTVVSNSKRGCNMKRFAVAGMALAVLTAPAAAADMMMANKAPPPAFSWTGFYIGGDIGVAATTGNSQSNALPSSVLPSGVQQISGGVGGGGNFAGGGFAGYNLQFAPTWVAGIEADWTSMNTDGRLTSNWLDNTGVMVQNAVTTLSSELQWAASVRGRIGYLIVPSFLAYTIGGVAWGKWEFGANSADPAIGYAASTAFAKTDTGWVAGIGFEWAPFSHYGMLSGLLLRAEYLNYRFGGTQATAAAAGFPTAPSAYLWSNPDVNVGRIGASYKF